MRSFLHKQGHYLLDNQLYAFFLVALLAFLPFMAWLSLSVSALITLRKGSYEGLKALTVGVTVSLIAASAHASLPNDNMVILTTFSMGYVASLVLRASANWKAVVAIILALSLLIMSIIHWLAPDFIRLQFHALLEMFRALGQGTAVLDLLDGLKGSNQELLANYLLGIQAVSIVFSALSSVMLARFMQSILFYPEGFRKEILAFRASRFGVIMLLISAGGAWQHNPAAISFLPILVVYLMTAGMSLLFKVIGRKRDLFTMLLLFIPLIIVPYIMLPLYVLFGSLDSLFNFRLRLFSKTGEIKE